MSNTDDLVGQCVQGLADLMAAAEQSTATADREREETLHALEDEQIQRLVEQSPELRDTVESWRKDAEQAAADGKESLDRLHRSVKEWQGSLDELRALSPE